MKLELYLADKLFSQNKRGNGLSRKSSIIATISVAISVAVIVVAIVISNGFRYEINKKCAGCSGDMWMSAVGVPLYNSTSPVFADKKTIEEIGNLDFVKNIQPIVYTQGLFKMPDDVEGIIVKGIDSSYNRSTLNEYLVDGKIPLYKGAVSNDIVISKLLQNRLNINVGDKIEAYFVSDDIKVRRFTVAGIYSTGIDEIDKLLIYADSRHPIKINGWENNNVSGYEIFINNSVISKDRAKLMIEDIVYESSAEFSDSLLIYTVADLFYALYDWLNLIDLNVLIILLLMIIVSGFNMVSGILIMIFERISQIGLLKSIGMYDRSITMAFIISSLRVILKGMIIGNVIALLCCYIQQQFNIIPLDSANYFVSSVPIYFNWIWICGVNVILVVAIILILLMPLHFIKKISPAKILAVK